MPIAIAVALRMTSFEKFAFVSALTNTVNGNFFA